MTVAKRVYYSGRVQGVGFRATAREIAHKYVMAGFIRNLPGGDVELVAEGEPVAVDAFLEAVAHAMAGSISHTAVHDEPTAGLTGFTIRF